MSTAVPRSIVASLSAALALSAAGSAQVASTERASLDSTGAQANNESAGASISGDGRFVAFYGSATNLVAGDTNFTSDVFVRDRLLGATARVSVATGGAQGGGQSQYPAISADGSVVVFYSEANNLVVNDTNGWGDLFAHVRASGTTERVSVGPAGSEANAGSLEATVSSDGRFVAFASAASNFAAGDMNATLDVFVRDRVGGTTTRVSVAASGGDSNSFSRRPAISADGRYVAFRSHASNLVAGDVNGWTDIFVRDLLLGTTQLVSVGPGGVQSNGDNREPSISADGRFVAFESSATTLVAGDTNGFTDIFVRDLAAGTTQRVSLASSGAQSGAVCNHAAISADGRFVAFHSDASNLVLGDTNFAFDVFVHDRTSAVTERVSLTSAGAQVIGSSQAPSISADGRFVAFQSIASDLVAGDTNGVLDVFVRDRGVFGPVTFCTAGTTTNGCNASMSASANPSVSLTHSCALIVAGVEGQKSGLIFYGIDNSAFVPPPWTAGSSSFLCVKPPTQRTPVQNSGGTASLCDGGFALDWNAFQASNPSALGNPWSSGASVFAQAWLRDPPAPKSTHLSNAVELTYVP